MDLLTKIDLFVGVIEDEFQAPDMTEKCKEHMKETYEEEEEE